jgi:hypothetical protein
MAERNLNRRLKSALPEVTGRLRELEPEISQKEEELQRLREEQSQLLAIKRSAEALLAPARAGKRETTNALGEAGTSRSERLTPETAAPGKPVRGPALVEVIRNILREAGNPLHYTEIASRAKQAGYLIAGKNKGANVLAHISRKPELFQRYERGTWGLQSPESAGKHEE